MAKTNSQAILKTIEMRQKNINIPEFKPGDSVSLHLKLTENNRTRIQKFDGVVLGRSGTGLAETITVRKETDGIRVEKIFALHSPVISKFEVIKHGRVRRAKLYYLRKLKGKATRIRSATKK